MNQQDKIRLLGAYQKGTISPDDKRLLELAALEDAFLFDALEGSHESTISVGQLREKLQGRVKKERKRIMWLPAVAATLLVVSALMWWNDSDENSLSKESQYVQVEKPKDILEEAPRDIVEVDIEEKVEKLPIKTAVQQPIVDGIPVKKDKVENQVQSTKNKIDSYLEQRPSVTASGVTPQSPAVIVEDKSIEEDFEDVLVGDLNTEYNPERVIVESEEEEIIDQGVEESMPSVQGAPAAVRAKARPTKEKKRKMEQEADLAEEVYPVLDEIVVTNMKTSSPNMGYEDLKKFIFENKLIGLENKKIKGRVRLKFIVNAKGELTEFEVLKSINNIVDQHTIELMKKTGVWSPGEASYTVKY